MDYIDEAFVDGLLSDTETLFLNIHAFQCTLHSLPGKSHEGLSITYQDILERREDFLRELKNTLCSWIYSKKRFQKIFEELAVSRGGDAQGAFSQIQRMVEGVRRKGFPQGQYGELLLFNVLQHYFKATPLLRKMPITTNAAIERHGADAIHYRPEGEAHVVYLGEAKTYTASGFFRAVRDSTESIIASFQNFSKELGLYVYQDFIEEELRSIAKGIKNNSLKNLRYELVCVVTYRELADRKGINESELKKAIEAAVQSKIQKFDLTFFNDKPEVVLAKIHFFMMPIWGLSELLEDFDK